MLTTSACAVGSFVDVTRFVPSAIISPFLTTTAPNGPPRLSRTFSTESSIARRINLSWSSIKSESNLLQKCQNRAVELLRFFHHQEVARARPFLMFHITE